MTHSPVSHSQKLDGGAHSRLDVDGLDVVPSLLQERGKEVERHHDVLLELFISHLDVTDSGGHARNLLKLELNGGTGVHDLLFERLLVGDNGWESLDPGKDGSNDNRHLLQDGVGSEQERVLLGPLLHELLVLVEQLELVERLDVDVELALSGLFSVLSISDKADLEVRSGHVGKSDRADETLILLGIVVLQANLELDRLTELAGLDSSAEVNDALEHHSVGKFRTHSVFPSLIIINIVQGFPTFKRAWQWIANKSQTVF